MKIYIVVTVNANEPFNSSVSVHKTRESAVEGVLDAIRADYEYSDVGDPMHWRRWQMLDEARESLEKYGEYASCGDCRTYLIKESII